MVGLVALRFWPGKSVGRGESETQLYEDIFADQTIVEDIMVLEQGQKVYIADTATKGREGYVLYRSGGAGSAVYAAYFAGGRYETFNLRLLGNSTEEDPLVTYKRMNKPSDWDEHIERAKQHLGGGRDGSPGRSSRKRYQDKSWIGSFVIACLDVWGLRWTRKRIGTAGATALALYRGYRWFNVKEKAISLYADTIGQFMGFLDDFGFDEEWRAWVVVQIKDKDNLQGLAFMLFILFLTIMFFADGDFTCVWDFVVGGDSSSSGGAGGSSGRGVPDDRLQDIIDENRRLRERLEVLEKKKDGGGDGSDGSCNVMSGEPQEIEGGLSRLMDRLKAHKDMAAGDAGRVPTGGAGTGVEKKKKEDDEDEDDASKKSQKQSVDSLVNRLEKGLKNPTEAFLKQLKQFKEMDDWPMPPGAKERLAPEFLGETVYRGGQDAKKYWASYMHDHGIEEAPAAQDGMSAAVSLDFLLLVDGADVVNSTAVESLARELYGLSRCFEACKQKSDWRKPGGADGKGWVSKAQYGLRDRYSIRALPAGKVRHEGADKEVRKGMETEALFNKYYTKAADLSPAALGVDGGG